MFNFRYFAHTLLFISSLTLNIHGEIREIKYINEFQYPNNPNILVAFDIDNTIMELSTDLGSDQWFYAGLKHLTQQGISTDDALQKIVPLYIHYQRHGSVNPVEPEIIQIIKKLHKNNIPTIALTARTNPIEDLTIQQLKSVGIRFDKNKFHKKTFTFTHTPYPAFFKKGIVFCGNNNNKGEVLCEFIAHVQLKPSLIIFVDDKRRHLEAVETFLKKFSIPFLGLRYGYLDEKIQQFHFDESMLNFS